MLAPPAADRRRLEYSLSRQAPLIEEEFRPIAQLVPEPGLDRHGETHLRPIHQFARHVAVEHTPQETLAHAVPSLHRREQRPAEGNKSMIEQRYPRFERNRHRRPVDLGQDVVRQISERIEILHALDKVGHELAYPCILERPGWLDPRCERARRIDPE